MRYTVKSFMLLLGFALLFSVVFVSALVIHSCTIKPLTDITIVKK